jgi:hypothetical protein
VPGLFQTEGYARAVLERHPNVTTEQVAERLTARLARQSVLERTDPLLHWVLLDENTLERHVHTCCVVLVARRSCRTR